MKSLAASEVFPARPPAEPGRLRVWLLAARPQTLAASVVPVLIGAACARHSPAFSWSTLAAILAAALLIQIGTNLVNDLADFLKGADTGARLGPLRVTQAGLATPRQMVFASVLVLGLALIIGIYLAALGGAPILVIGLLSLLCAVAYTAGPYPLAYLGLGDIFVLIFFGPVAVGGTYLLLAGEIAPGVVLLGLSPGMIAAAILVVNNIRDRAGDAASNKKTLAVRFGLQAARMEFAVLLLGAGALPPALAAGSLLPPGAAVAGFFLLAALPVLKTVLCTDSAAALNVALAQTAKLLVLFGALLIFGLFLVPPAVT